MAARRPPPRRRPTRRDYMVRRAGALAVLVLLVVLVVSAVRTIGGGGDAAADATTTSTAAAPDGSSPGASVAPVGSAPVTSVDQQAPDRGSRVPTAQDPAVVYVAGDSDAGAFGPYLDTLVEQTGVATVTLDYKVSSGLARPDFFDWPAHLRSKLPQVDPDIVVVTFGGNDGQPIKGHQVDTPEWRAEYGRRVGEVMDLLMADGRTLIWVGIPNAASADMTARAKVQDEVVRAQAAERPQVVFIDTWKRFSGRDGGYAEYVVDPRDNVGKDVRADDGFHLNVEGAEILALDIAEAVRADLTARGAAL